MALNSAAAAALSNLQPSLDVRGKGTYADFIAVVNASPTLQEQLNAYVARGGTISVKSIEDNGQYLYDQSSANNTALGSLTLNSTLLPVGSWSLGYQYGETLAHELGHAFDTQYSTRASLAAVQGNPTQTATLQTKSEALAEQNSIQVMNEVVPNLLASGNISNTGAGKIFDPSSLNETSFRFAETDYNSCMSGAATSGGSATSGLSKSETCFDGLVKDMGGPLGGNYFNTWRFQR